MRPLPWPRPPTRAETRDWSDRPAQERRHALPVAGVIVMLVLAVTACSDHDASGADSPTPGPTAAPAPQPTTGGGTFSRGPTGGTISPQGEPTSPYGSISPPAGPPSTSGTPGPTGPAPSFSPSSSSPPSPSPSSNPGPRSFEISGPTLESDYNSGWGVVYRPGRWCAPHYPLSTDSDLRIVSVTMSPPFEVGATGPCTNASEPAPGRPTCVGFMFRAGSDRRCYVVVELPQGVKKEDYPNRAIVFEYLTLCTSRAGTACAALPADANPTPSDPVRATWSQSVRLQACLASSPPSEGPDAALNFDWDCQPIP